MTYNYTYSANLLKKELMFIPSLINYFGSKTKSSDNLKSK